MRSGFFVQVCPSAEPQIDTSSDSCSIWSETVRRQRNVRVGLAEMSNAAPTPLASMQVSCGTRSSFVGIVDSRVRILAQGDKTNGQRKTVERVQAVWRISEHEPPFTEPVQVVEANPGCLLSMMHRVVS